MDTPPLPARSGDRGAANTTTAGADAESGRRCDDAPTVDIWVHDCDTPVDPVDDEAVLDATERARAARFRFERDRQRYLQRHAFARRVLARYQGCDPSRIGFAYGRHGKPTIDGSRHVSFNLSHDDGLAVLVVGDGRAVGIDVERSRTIPRVEELAAGLFARDEAEALRSAEPAARSTLFLTLWTRKEAVAKAMGVGLSLPPAGFSVLLAAGSVVGHPTGVDGELPYAFAPLMGLGAFVGTVACAGGRLATRRMNDGPSRVEHDRI